MINPVGHSHRNDQTDQTRSAQPRAAAQKTNDNRTQDTVTLSNTSDVDHDGENK